MIKILEKVEEYTLYMVLGLFAVFVLPFFASPFIVPKEILLIIGVAVLLIIWVAKIIIKGSLSFSVGKFDLGILLVAVSYLLSTILATPNKADAFLFPGTTTFVLSGAVLYFLINQYDKKVKEKAGLALFAGAILLSLSILLSTVSLFSKIPQLPAFMKDPAFNPIGGNIPAGIYLFTLLIYSGALFIKERESVRKMFFGVATAFMLFGIVLLTSQALPGKPQSPKLVSTQVSWEVAVESLKKSPLFGSGPANYLTAFNLFRPVAYNQTGLWQLRFTTASNQYFTLLTETGFVGLAALVILLISAYKFFVATPKSDYGKYSLTTLLILFAVLPIAPLLMILLFVLFAIFSDSEGKTLHLKISSGTNSFVTSRGPSIIVGTLIVIGTAAILFLQAKTVIAEATFKKSLDALNKNDAKGTFDLMTKSINQNSRVDRYHASLAQVDMAIASSLASKKDISDADRQTITQLVQQAINEGKATVSLNPGRSGNWEILAQIYRAIMPFATGADQFTIQTYTQAVALDPTNPNLRIALGGVYYALGRYDDAIDSFKLAVLAKSDLANAHYNLAIAYREKKDFDNAIAEMNNVLGLVDKNSQDYELAKKTLDDLEKNRPSSAKATEGQGNLQAPAPVEESNVKPPIALPEEATPPAATHK